MLGKGLESLIPPLKQNENNASLGSGAPISTAGDEALKDEPAVGFAAGQAKSEPIRTSFPFDEKTDVPAPAAPVITSRGDSFGEAGLSNKTMDQGKEEELGELPPAVRPVMEVVKPEADDLPKKTEAVFQIEVEKIKPNPYQPRRYFDERSLRELANSIREFGIIQPLILSKIFKETEHGTEVEYQLIAGERRLLAAKMVGLRTVPAIIRSVSVEREKLEMAVIENLQRSDLNPIEAARAYAKLQDEFGLTQREIASRLGKSRETVANTIRLLSLPSEIQVALEEGKINESQARLLLQIDDIAKQREIFRSLLEEQPTVRELRQKIKSVVSAASMGETPKINPALLEIKSKLEEALGTKVNIRDEGNRGKVVIDFYSFEELSHLVEKITRQNDNRFL